MTSRSITVFCLFGFALSISGGSAPTTTSPVITTESLFREMVDLDRLTRFPSPVYRTVQFSSFDRRSDLPGGPGWYANSDGFGGEPVPNFEKVVRSPGPDGIGEYLVAEAQGPGAVVRLWSAAISGSVRVTIDGSRPLYEGPAEPFFRRVYDCFDEAKALDRELLDKTVYQRDAAYAPIPFRKKLRIVWIGKIKEIHFYQVGVRLYRPGTRVVSFKPGDLSNSAAAINAVLADLADPAKLPRKSPEGLEVPFTASLPPGEKAEILSAQGPRAIVGFSIRCGAEDLDRALRQTVLRVICDDAVQPQVQSPLGDFFGAAPGVNPFASLPFSVHADGTMDCRFVMPFKTSLKIQLENMSVAPVNVIGSALLEPYAWDETRSLHFRARWRADHGLVGSNREVQDLPFLLALGRGLYVGSASHILNPSPIPTPYGSWWGEGDEKVFVDGDAVPAAFGTGSEDYYNYSWSAPDIFAYPYCGQPRNDGPGNRGFVTNFRWHIPDPFPFENSLAFYLELYPHERTPGLSYCRIGYYYARPGVFDDHRPISPDDLRDIDLPLWEPAARMGARNAEFVSAEKALTDSSNTVLRGGRIFAGAAALVWSPDQTGETKDFTMTVSESGRHRIHVAFVLNGESGSAGALLDGRPVAWVGGAERAELRAPGRTMIRMYGLEPLDLAAGEHILTLKFAGADPDVGHPEIGVDFIGLQKVDR